MMRRKNTPRGLLFFPVYLCVVIWTGYSDIAKNLCFIARNLKFIIVRDGYSIIKIESCFFERWKIVRCSRETGIFLFERPKKEIIAKNFLSRQEAETYLILTGAEDKFTGSQTYVI